MLGLIRHRLFRFPRFVPTLASPYPTPLAPPSLLALSISSPCSSTRCTSRMSFESRHPQFIQLLSPSLAFRFLAPCLAPHSSKTQSALPSPPKYPPFSSISPSSNSSVLFALQRFVSNRRDEFVHHGIFSACFASCFAWFVAPSPEISCFKTAICFVLFFVRSF